MARRKIRHFGPQAYDLSPDETLVGLYPSDPVLEKRWKKEITPRLGKGSGRAGGARSATHIRDHIQTGRVDSSVSVVDCAICRYGLKLWELWVNSCGGTSEQWLAYWEPYSHVGERDEERLTCEAFMKLCEGTPEANDPQIPYPNHETETTETQATFQNDPEGIEL